MWARWITLLAVVVGCQEKQPPAAKATGSANVVATAPADAHAIDAPDPTLAIACGPAMLAPRIPPPPKKQASVDPLQGLLGQPGLGTGDGFGVGGLGDGGGVAIGELEGTGVGGGLSGAHRTDDQGGIVRFGTITMQGSLDKAIVLRFLKRAQGRFKACFDSDAQKTNKTEQAVDVQLVIDMKGRVPSVTANGDANACIQGALRQIPFPANDSDGISIARFHLAYSAVPATSRGRAAVATQAAPKPVAKLPPIPDTRSWTPYAASLGLASDDTAQAAGDELVKLMPLAKLEKCFAGKDAAERAMVTVAFDGAVISARTGGSGDAQVDSCIAVSLIGLKVTAPPTVSEVACDIVRGAPQPWRVAPESYTVIEVGDKEIKEGGVVLTKDKLVPANGDATHAFLIVVDPAAPPTQLSRAFERTQWAGATLVALESDSGSPVFIAMGLDGRMREKDYAPMLGIQHVKDDVKSCVDKEARGTAPKAEVETLLQTLANACDPKPCPATLSIALGGTMQDLAADADAARRAKLTRIGLSTTGCP